MVVTRIYHIASHCGDVSFTRNFPHTLVQVIGNEKISSSISANTDRITEPCLACETRASESRWKSKAKGNREFGIYASSVPVRIAIGAIRPTSKNNHRAVFQNPLDIVIVTIDEHQRVIDWVQTNATSR